jgi:excisionase family DNA binding protein
MEEKLITTREASQFLGISEQDVLSLANSGQLNCIKVGGEYIRFRKKYILSMKDSIRNNCQAVSRNSRMHENIREFFHFYDFYIISAAIIAVLLWVILKDLRS